MRLSLTCLVVLLAHFCAAQATLAIKAGRLLDVRTGAVLKDQIVLIQGPRIIDIGPGLAIPAGVETLDLSNYTVLPGMFDCHTHLLLNFDGAIGGDNVNGNLTLAQEDTLTRVLYGARHAREYLEAGVTTVRDLGNSGTNGDVALRNAIRSGWLPGPRILAATRAISSTGGQFGRLPLEKQKLIDEEYAVISGVEEARKAVRQAMFDGADVIKVIVDTFPQVLTLEELKVIVEEAHRVHKKVAAHCITAMAIKIACDAGVDSIEHAYTISDDLLKLMASKGIYLVPTDSIPELYIAGQKLTPEERAENLKMIEGFLASSHDRVRRAKALGVRIAAGSDMYYFVPGKTRGVAALAMLRAYAASGLTPLEVIQAATINAADLCGLGAVLGAVEKSKIADIIAVPGDPLADLTVLEKVSFVVKDGKVVKRG